MSFFPWWLFLIGYLIICKGNLKVLGLGWKGQKFPCWSNKVDNPSILWPYLGTIYQVLWLDYFGVLTSRLEGLSKNINFRKFTTHPFPPFHISYLIRIHNITHTLALKNSRIQVFKHWSLQASFKKIPPLKIKNSRIPETKGSYLQDLP